MTGPLLSRGSSNFQANQLPAPSVQQVAANIAPGPQDGGGVQSVEKGQGRTAKLSFDKNKFRRPKPVNIYLLKST